MQRAVKRDSIGNAEYFSANLLEKDYGRTSKITIIKVAQRKQNLKKMQEGITDLPYYCGSVEEWEWTPGRGPNKDGKSV